MFGRSFWMILVLVAAVGVPYIASEWSKLKANVLGESSTKSTGVVAKSDPSAAVVSATQSAAVAGADRANPDATPLVDLDQAFRFNVSPVWIMGRWPRVSSGLPDEQLHGLRVALISGVKQDDLAGSLTYYFTPTQRCAKITFSGTTGDPRRMTKLMTERFGFKPFTTGEPGVERYEIRWNGQATSEYVIRPAAVVRSSTPYARYDVKLAITEPSAR